jgi:hypothetical protein
LENIPHGTGTLKFSNGDMFLGSWTRGVLVDGIRSFAPLNATMPSEHYGRQPIIKSAEFRLAVKDFEELWSSAPPYMAKILENAFGISNLFLSQASPIKEL